MIIRSALITLCCSALLYCSRLLIPCNPLSALGTPPKVVGSIALSPEYNIQNPNILCLPPLVHAATCSHQQLHVHIHSWLCFECALIFALSCAETGMALFFLPVLSVLCHATLYCLPSIVLCLLPTVIYHYHLPSDMCLVVCFFCSVCCPLLSATSYLPSIPFVKSPVILLCLALSTCAHVCNHVLFRSFPHTSWFCCRRLFSLFLHLWCLKCCPRLAVV